MIRSMTAFASGERGTPWGAIGAELRSVNHRFLELAVKLPEELRSAEPALRERVAAQVQRGKTDLVLRLRPGGEGAAAIALDMGAVRRLSEIAQELEGMFPRMRVDFSELLRVPGVLADRPIDVDGLAREAVALVDSVLAEFVNAREREGTKLRSVMVERLEGIAALTAQVRQWLPGIRQALRLKLEARLAELQPPVDPGRLEQELVLGLQKLDVDEELDRLDAHVAEARRVLDLDEAVGRRLDFLLQEFNREANTLGSKSVDQRTSQVAVELKVLIEQLREQVQNVE
ncbi:MAG TPA: YicC/YloC family endoribonuclease [Xanthomonadaceae bacterium]|nr:YicC/YloC family endoribonuclease [Xanthomonadaceae bacterium]